MYQAPDGWSCTIIEYQQSRPYIFLLDERHDSQQVIDDNLTLGRELIHTQGVGLVGVENFPCRIDPYNGDQFHIIDRPSALIVDNHPIGAEIRFARGIVQVGVPVLGIDSEGLMNELEMAAPANYGEYPANIQRSINFVLSLFQEREDRALDCSVLINCGSNHNQHILDIANGIRDIPANWPSGSYIRLRSLNYP